MAEKEFHGRADRGFVIAQDSVRDLFGILEHQDDLVSPRRRVDAGQEFSSVLHLDVDLLVSHSDLPMLARFAACDGAAHSAASTL